VWRWTLEGSAFGQHAALSDPDADGVALEFNLRYPGQYFDSATGLHYNYFRDYEAGTGRYVQSDPIGLGDGHSTYGYVEVTPLMGSDPLGLYRGPRQDWDPSFPKPLPQCKDNLFDPPKLPPCTWTYSKYRECVKYCIGALRSVEIAVASAALSTPDLLQRTVGSCWKLAKKAATTYTVATAGTCLFHCSMFPCAQDYQ
jgi:RHS repeat-associated protein